MQQICWQKDQHKIEKKEKKRKQQCQLWLFSKKQDFFIQDY